MLKEVRKMTEETSVIPNVGVSARVVDRNVGGNTRYARAIHCSSDDCSAPGYVSVMMRPPATSPSRVRSVAYLAYEGLFLPARSDVDLLHYPADTGPLRQGRVPMVTTVHGVAALHVPGVRSRRDEYVWLKRVECAIRNSQHVITVSQSSKRDIVEAFSVSADEVSVIPHGVDQKFRDAADREPDRELLERAGLPQRYLLYLGNIEPRKNLPVVVAAGRSVYRRTGIPTVIAGSPAWSSSDLMQLIADAASEGVIHVGRLPEAIIPDALSAASIFCFPSRYEGFGLPVLEAMASGTPVVCSDRGALREIAEGAALIVEDLGADQVTEAIMELLCDADLRSEMSAAGVVRSQEFDWEVSRKEHHNVFDKVVRSCRPSGRS
jgi:alpha-1,3-rhamnosyl/mannosyltransferase